MATKRKPKQAEPVSVSISGSATVAADFDIDDRVILIVEGTVTKVGETSTASKGHVQVRTVRCDSLLPAPSDLREQLAVLVQQAKDDAAGVISIDFPEFDAEPEGEPE